MADLIWAFPFADSLADIFQASLVFEVSTRTLTVMNSPARNAVKRSSPRVFIAASTMDFSLVRWPIFSTKNGSPNQTWFRFAPTSVGFIRADIRSVFVMRRASKMISPKAPLTATSSLTSFKRLMTTTDSTIATWHHGVDGARRLSAGAKRLKRLSASMSICQLPITSHSNQDSALT